MGEQARCARCNDVIQTRKPHTVDRTLAATLAGIVLLVMSLFLPFLSLTRAGIESHMSVIDAVEALWQSRMRWLGLLTLTLIILVPMARMVLLAWVLWRIRFGRPIMHNVRRAFRWALLLEPWAMADIFMVGVIVSLVKISSLASLQLGLAFWCLMLLVGVSLLIDHTMCRDSIWSQISPIG